MKYTKIKRIFATEGKTESENKRKGEVDENGREDEGPYGSHNTTD